MGLVKPHHVAPSYDYRCSHMCHGNATRRLTTNGESKCVQAPKLQSQVCYTLSVAMRVPQVRRAFTADVAAGNTLVVADYGQLELRLLAHMAGCRSMLEAFKLGGDFHSRTALGMYDHIKDAVANGTRVLANLRLAGAMAVLSERGSVAAE